MTITRQKTSNKSKPMDERLRFIARLLEGEKMSPLCREFGISRVTGYKIFNRYKDCGLDGLNDRSRWPTFLLISQFNVSAQRTADLLSGS